MNKHLRRGSNPVVFVEVGSLLQISRINVGSLLGLPSVHPPDAPLAMCQLCLGPCMCAWLFGYTSLFTLTVVQLHWFSFLIKLSNCYLHITINMFSRAALLRTKKTAPACQLIDFVLMEYIPMSLMFRRRPPFGADGLNGGNDCGLASLQWGLRPTPHNTCAAFRAF